MKIYQLSQFQYDNIHKSTNGSGPIFVILGALETDDKAQKDRIAQHEVETKDLVELGLLEDVTEKLADHAKKVLGPTGRTFSLYLPTDTGFLMFNRCNDREIQ